MNSIAEVRQSCSEEKTSRNLHECFRFREKEDFEFSDREIFKMELITEPNSPLINQRSSLVITDEICNNIKKNQEINEAKVTDENVNTQNLETEENKKDSFFLGLHQNFNTLLTNSPESVEGGQKSTENQQYRFFNIVTVVISNDFKSSFKFPLKKFNSQPVVTKCGLKQPSFQSIEFFFNLETETETDIFHEMTQKQEKVFKSGCQCKYTSCLKLYCECFKNNGRCTVFCKCLDCSNIPENQDILRKLYQKIDKRKNVKINHWKR